MSKEVKEILIIDGEEFIKEESIPGEGFETKEDEEKFIEEYIKSLEEQDKYDIYSVGLSSKYKS